MPPLVSVLITVYNREKYVTEAIESVLAQTFQDFELIIVDDCSKDASVEMARRYEADPRVNIHINDRNLGDYANRNSAASRASGKYLKYVDADDLIYPHSLAVMVAGMEKWPEAGLGLSWNVIDPPKPYPFLSSPREVMHEHFLGRSILGVGPSAAIIRHEAFAAAGGFSGRQFVGDAELWLKLSQGWPVVSLPPSLIWWRRHEAQQMALEQGIMDVLHVRFEMEHSILMNTGLLNEQDRRNARLRLRQHHARRLLSLGIRSRQPVQTWRLFRKSGLGLHGLLRGLHRYQ